MVRINKEEIKGITDDRKRSSCAAAHDNSNAAGKEKGGAGAFCCEGDKCQIEWTDD